MTRKFTEFAFTPSVKALQERNGTRAQNARLEASEDIRDRLGEAEADFIAARDGFYIATTGENGWPYVQFRGGPKGFLKVLDERNLAYADFRGNVQYITAGNLDHDGRAALILMDYAHRRRLKLWVRIKVVDAAAAPELVATLRMPGYRARIERAMVMTLEAFDWNCPQHITPRFTEDEIRQMLIPVQARIAELEEEIAFLKRNADRMAAT